MSEVYNFETGKTVDPMDLPEETARRVIGDALYEQLLKAKKDGKQSVLTVLAVDVKNKTITLG